MGGPHHAVHVVQPNPNPLHTIFPLMGEVTGKINAREVMFVCVPQVDKAQETQL